MLSTAPPSAPNQGDAHVTDTHGRFSWYELLTTDMEGARTFYADVVGWGTQDASTPGNAYTFFRIGQTPVSGMMYLPDQVKRRGGSQCWIGYVAVDDVDASFAQLRQLGGSVYLPPTDVPGVSRVAVVTDVQRTTIALVKWLTPPEQAASATDKIGRVGWHELLAVDREKALAFYRALFGWQNGGMETSAGRSYQVVSVAGKAFGGISNKPEMVKLPFWLFYFGVGDIDAAVERVKARGGRILEGPLEFPGVRIARCEDPQGAMFALMGPPRRFTRPVGYFERTEGGERSGPQGRRWSW
jgi:uncharacterized protein